MSSSRRHFIALSAAPLAARTVAANDRINVGIIGTGGMGTGHLRAFVAQAEQQKDIQVTAVSDVYTRRKERARTLAKLAEKDVHHDYRELLARGDVDAVGIATPHHGHARLSHLWHSSRRRADPQLADGQRCFLRRGPVGV